MWYAHFTNDLAASSSGVLLAARGDMRSALGFALSLVMGCSGGSFVVASDGDAGGSNDAATCESKNACGGCGNLAAKPGDTCGTCGTWTCSKDGSRVDCEDPGKNVCGGCGSLPGKPGDACGGGSCGTGKYACVDQKLVCQGATGANKCGGCKPLTNEPGTPCGVCGGAVWECKDPEAVTCKDPVSTPHPGTVCGTCSTSSYKCSADGRSTFCQKPDDRTSVADIDVAGNANLATTDRSRSTAIQYTVKRDGDLKKLVVKLKRVPYTCPRPADDECTSPDKACSCTTASGACKCTTTSIDAGSLKLSVYKGKISELGPTLPLLATLVVPFTAVSEVASDVVISLPSGLSSTKGATFTFVFETDATAAAYEVFGIGAGAPVPADVVWAQRSNFTSSPTWVTASAAPRLALYVFGCP